MNPVRLPEGNASRCCAQRRIEFAYSAYGPPGAPRMAYSDLEYHECPAIRMGTSFTFAREDRFSSNPAANPENVALYNSHGTLFFATGSLAPGVTVQYSDVYVSSWNFGYKHRGFAFNSQYYLRWLNDFVADGPLPLSGTLTTDSKRARATSSFRRRSRSTGGPPRSSVNFATAASTPSGRLGTPGRIAGFASSPS